MNKFDLLSILLKNSVCGGLMRSVILIMVLVSQWCFAAENMNKGTNRKPASKGDFVCDRTLSFDPITVETLLAKNCDSTKSFSTYIPQPFGTPVEAGKKLDGVVICCIQK